MSQTEENQNGRSGGFLNGRPVVRAVAIGIGVLLLIAAIVFWQYSAARESTDDAQIDCSILPVSPRVGGTVALIQVHDNQEVEPGTVLVELDAADYRVALAKAQAEYDEAVADAKAAHAGVPITTVNTSGNISVADAGLAAAEKEVTSASARLQAAQAHLREAEAMHARTARDLDRMKLLIGKDEVSQQQYDSAGTSEAQAAAVLESARAEVALAEQQVQVAESHVHQARAGVRMAGTGPQQLEATQARAASADANVQRAKAALDQAKLNLEYTRIKAPVRGVISKKSVEVGQVVQPGQPLFSLVLLDNIWVTANFKETQLKRMRPGQPVVVEVDGYGGREYRGHVDSISPATGARFSLLPPENATGNYVKIVQRVPVKIVFEQGQDPDHVLRPGMSVTPTVLTR